MIRDKSPPAALREGRVTECAPEPFSACRRQFGTLEAFYPGRIDLGIGRSLGGTKRTALLLRGESERSARRFAEQIDEFLGYFDPRGDPKIRAIPAEFPIGMAARIFWDRRRLAGALGLPNAFAHHLNPDAAASASRLHPESFCPSPTAPEPRVLVSVSVIAAETYERAHWLAGPSKRKFLGRQQGERILLPPPAEAAAYPYTEQDKATIDERFARVVIGSPETVREGLQVRASLHVEDLP